MARIRFDENAETEVRVAGAEQAGAALADSPSFEAALDELVERDVDELSAIQSFVKLVDAQERVVAVAYLRRAADGIFAVGPNTWTGVVFERRVFQDRIRHWAETAAGEKRMQTFRSGDVRNLATCCVPVETGGARADVLAVSVAVETEGSPAQAQWYRRAARAIGLWNHRRASRVRELELHAATAIIELVERIGGAERAVESGFVLVNELREFLDCDRVAVATKRGRQTRARMLAVSGAAEFDRQSELVRTIEEVCEETLLHKKLAAWPALEPSQRHALIAHRRLAEDHGHDCVVSVPLVRWSGEPMGVLVAAGDRTTVHSAERIHLLRTAAAPVGTALESACVKEGGFSSRLIKSMTDRAHRWKWRIAAGAMLATGLLLATPFPYDVDCACTLEPVQRRYSVAPHDGLVENTLVEPGDVVGKGQTLARMDGREVRWSLAGLAAERHQAVKQRDQSLAAGDVTTAQLAALEIERSDARTDLLRLQESHLEIVSPVEGIVLSGELEKESSAPVKVGQPLYEIAPLSPIRVEVAIPAADYSHAVPGDAVEIALEGHVGVRYRGTIGRIRPQSEIHDSKNVFIAEVVLPNEDGLLRPGMRGWASVTGKSHLLGWNLFHRPYEKVQEFLGL